MVYVTEQVPLKLAVDAYRVDSESVCIFTVVLCSSQAYQSPPEPLGTLISLQY